MYYSRLNEKQEAIQVNNLIRLNRVIERTGLSRSTIYAQIQNGTFPKPISLGERSVAWIDDEITDWIDAKISASRDLI